MPCRIIIFSSYINKSLKKTIGYSTSASLIICVKVKPLSPLSSVTFCVLLANTSFVAATAGLGEYIHVCFSVIDMNINSAGTKGLLLKGLKAY